MSEPLTQTDTYMPDGFDYMLAKIRGEYPPKSSVTKPQVDELLKKYTSTPPNPSDKITALAKLMSLKHNLSLDDVLKCIEGLALSDQEEVLKASI